MSLVFHDPRGATRRAPESYDCRLETGGPVTIGLLANGFPDSEAFLDAVEAALVEHEATLRCLRYNKHGASVPASDELLDRIAAECDALVTAYGH